MNAINKLLDEAREKNKFKSDNQLAIAIGITRTSISYYRHGKSTPDIYTMNRLADLTKKPLGEIAAIIETECEPDKKKKEYWKEVAKKLGEKAKSTNTVY
jgi:transcriptional regulator with XRE-family HTH domain